MAEASVAIDPFDNLDAFRLSANYTEGLQVKKPLLRVPVRKPNRQEFVQTHPDPSYAGDFRMLEVKEDREYYLFTPGVTDAILEEIQPIRLITAMNRQGVVFLWPLKLPTADGKRNAWHDSALELSERARSRWTRVMANMSLGAYEAFEALGGLDGPTWPDLAFPQLVRIAFRDGRLIDDLDHLVIQRLQGLA